MDIKQMEAEYKKDLETIATLEILNDIKNKYLSKKGKISDLMAKMREIPNEEKASYGQQVNSLKTLISEGLDNIKNKLESEKLSNL